MHNIHGVVKIPKHNCFALGIVPEQGVETLQTRQGTKVKGDRVREEDRLPLTERIRDVATAPDGAIYVLTDEDNGKVWRLSAMEKKSAGF